MPTSKHTPKPWTGAIEFHKPFDESMEDKRSIVLLMSGGDKMRAEANFNLAFAAPDLLAALEAVVSVADRATIEFDAARAAIAKARGE